MYDVSTAHCLACGHDTKKMACKCEGCEFRRQKEEMIRIEKEAERLKQRALYLERLYNCISPINFEKADLIELIYLYTLCHQSSCEDITLISPPSTAESPLTPADDWDKNVIQEIGRAHV